MDALVFLAAPALAVLLMATMMAYLGSHVLEREVIFVDLSIAQTSALGSAVALSFGLEEHSPWVRLVALAFALLAGAFFAWTRRLEQRVPQEALIGAVYAVATAATLLVLTKAHLGHDHVRAMLVGTLLWVGWMDVLLAAAVFGLIGILLIRVHSSLFLVSSDAESARLSGLRVLRWDLLFFSVFAVVISFSVHLAGVLLVFTLLVVPALVGRLFAQVYRARLMIGIGLSVSVNMVGLLLSFGLDLPAGATIVVLFGVVLLGALVVAAIRGPQRLIAR